MSAANVASPTSERPRSRCGRSVVRQGPSAEPSPKRRAPALRSPRSWRALGARASLGFATSSSLICCASLPSTTSYRSECPSGSHVGVVASSERRVSESRREGARFRDTSCRLETRAQPLRRPRRLLGRARTARSGHRCPSWPRLPSYSSSPSEAASSSSLTDSGTMTTSLRSVFWRSSRSRLTSNDANCGWSAIGR